MKLLLAVLARKVRTILLWLQQPAVLFMLVGYPLGLLFFFWLRQNLLPWLLLQPILAGAGVYIGSLLWICSALMAIVSRMLRHELQGQTLQIRERRGLDP